MREDRDPSTALVAGVTADRSAWRSVAPAATPASRTSRRTRSATDGSRCFISKDGHGRRSGSGWDSGRLCVTIASTCPATIGVRRSDIGPLALVATVQPPVRSVQSLEVCGRHASTVSGSGVNTMKRSNSAAASGWRAVSMSCGSSSSSSSQNPAKRMRNRGSGRLQVRPQVAAQLREAAPARSRCTCSGSRTTRSN